MRSAVLTALAELSYLNLEIARGRELKVGLRTPIPNNMAAIRKVLEDAGIKFIDRGKGGGPGVRLRK